MTTKPYQLIFQLERCGWGEKISRKSNRSGLTTVKGARYLSTASREDSFTCQCEEEEEEDKKADGFHISQFYWFFFK